MSGCLAPADIELYTETGGNKLQISEDVLSRFVVVIVKGTKSDCYRVSTTMIGLILQRKKKEISKPSNTANHYEMKQKLLLQTNIARGSTLLHTCTHSFESICNSRSLSPNFTVLNISMFQRINWFLEHQSLFKEEDISG